MFNRLFTGAATLVLFLILLFGRDFATYLVASADWVGNSVRSQIPVEFEIERARSMVNHLGPRIKESRYAVAREEVALEQLSEQITELKDRQEVARDVLTNLQHQLEAEEPRLKIGATIYTSAQAAKLAKTRFATYRAQDATVQSLEQAQTTRTDALELARQELEILVAAKQQLAAEVENLEARQRMAEVSQHSETGTLDDTHLERTRQLIHEIETRVRVEERLAQSLALDNTPPPTVVTTSDSGVGIASQIADYFNEDSNQQRSIAVVNDSVTTSMLKSEPSSW